VLIEQQDNDLGVKLRTDPIGHTSSLKKFHGDVSGSITSVGCQMATPTGDWYRLTDYD
jgi:hypothetical protein